MTTVPVGGKVAHTLFDHFDEQRENPIKLNFRKPLKKGDQFNINDVDYEVQSIGKAGAVVRMVRYKIQATTTQFVHKCPAKKSMMDKMNRDDVVKLEEKVGKKNLDRMKGGRVKMRAHNVTEQKCPLCKVVFWKDQATLPGLIQVNKVLGKKKKRKVRK